MASSVSLIFILVLSTVISCSIAISSPICANSSNFTTNSVYGKNRDLMLSRIYSNASSTENRFYMGTTGQGPNTVYGLGLCRADSSSADCSSCLRILSNDIQNKCPVSVEAYAWGCDPVLDYAWGGDPRCILRYSNISFFGRMEVTPADAGYHKKNITSNTKQFDEAWESLMDGLIEKAASGSSKLKFAAGELNTNVTLFQKIFAVLQCTPDLTNADCRNCLFQATKAYQTCCHGRQGGYVQLPSCLFRWDLYPFLKSSVYTSPPPPLVLNSPPPAINTKRGDGRNMLIIFRATIVLLAVAVALVVGSWTILRVRKKRERNHIDEGGSMDNIATVESLQFDFGTVQAATKNFSDGSKLGQGGFGTVYKGKLPNGQVVAVKRLSVNSGQGEVEFKNEVLLVAKLQHRCLVRLLGFCLQGNERILIYEFLPNTSLDYFIFDPSRRALLNWETRYNIIGGIARGLLYLHEDSRVRIIHRDLKASNILLDEDMNPKISDFRMARLFSLGETQGITSRIVGTSGYMAPEYALHGHFSVKSDVYSFGVLILEIVSGQKNNNFRRGEEVHDLICEAWSSWREGTTLNIVDPSLTTGSRTEMMRCIHVGLLCVQKNVVFRPHMTSVALMLNSSSITLPVPQKPASYFLSSINESNLSSDYSKSKSSKISNNEDSVTDLYPR